MDVVLRGAGAGGAGGALLVGAGRLGRAARHAHRAAVLQNPHFARNLALYRAQLASNLAHAGRRDEASAEARRVVDSLGDVQSSRIRRILTETGQVLATIR